MQNHDTLVDASKRRVESPLERIVFDFDADIVPGREIHVGVVGTPPVSTNGDNNKNNMVVNGGASQSSAVTRFT